MINGGDISKHRPAQPPVICWKCFHTKGDGKPDQVESTALHFGLPPTRYGVLLIRVNCHGEQQDIACTFKWLVANAGKPIDAFSSQPNDYGLRDMVERDGFSLPTNLTQCAYQLEAPQTGPLIDSIRAALRRGKECGYDDAERLRYSNALSDLATLAKLIEQEHRATGKTETHGKYVLARFVDRMDAEIVANERKGDWTKLRPGNSDICRRIMRCAQELTAMIKRSESSMVATGPVTEACADLANLAMKTYEVYGTPTTRPERWINEVLPNSAAGTSHDLPMRSESIDIKPAPPTLPALGPGSPGDQGYQ